MFVALCTGEGREVARVWRRCVRLVLKSRACATRKDYGTRTGRRNVKWLIHHLLFSLNTLDNGGMASSFELFQTTLPHYTSQASLRLPTQHVHEREKDNWVYHLSLVYLLER